MFDPHLRSWDNRKNGNTPVLCCVVLCVYFGVCVHVHVHVCACACASVCDGVGV